MNDLFTDPLKYLCFSLGIVLVIGLLMNFLSNNFYTLHVFVRKFSFLDLGSPATPLELATYINGIYALPKALGERSLRSLKTYLALNFLFMPFWYGTIFLLCVQLSMKFTGSGHLFFLTLGWVQIIAWICDIIQSVFLLKKIHPKTVPSAQNIHSLMQKIGIIKWILSPGVLVICISIMIYLWLSGNYITSSLRFFIIIAIEIAFFLWLKKASTKDPEVVLDKYHDVVN